MKIRYLLFVCLILTLGISAEENKKTICLNMIVKNESAVIKRCLDSVKSIIDYWVIVDTGSDDGTQDVIREHLKDIPGELHERPWRNFGFNRTQAFKLAKGKADYLLFMDADDTLEFDQEFCKKELKEDLYNMWRGIKTFSYIRPQIVRADLPWKFVGVTHEYLACDQAYTSQTLENVRYMSGDGGASSLDPKKKFLKNVKLLTAGLKKEPNNTRYAFYLAESYKDLGEKGKALECYQKRVHMGGWDEETFWAKFQIAALLREMGVSPNAVIEGYKDAHSFRLHRMEPIYYLAEMLNQQGRYAEAYAYLKASSFIPKPKEKDHLFNMDWVEQYGLLFQLSIAAYYVGNYQEALDSCDKLLAMVGLPANWRELAEKNRTYPFAKLEEEKRVAKSAEQPQNELIEGNL